MSNNNYEIKMMKNSMVTRFFFFVFYLFVSSVCLAQTTAAETQNQPVQMADGLRSSGKIYVVVAVLLTILFGLFIYLYRLDKKISKLEK